MENKRLIGLLTAPVIAAVGLLYGVVLGVVPLTLSGVDEPFVAPIESRSGTTAVRHGSAAPLPSATGFSGRASAVTVRPVAHGDAGAESPNPLLASIRTERAVPISERIARVRPLMDYAGNMLPLRDWRLGGLSVPGQTDYRDPVEDGSVQLVDVKNRGDVAISPHFRLSDFAASDGAAYARISPDLVELLEDLHDHFASAVHINSAYRHPALNFRAEVGGAVESRHLAGLAADVWVEGHTPFEVASAIVTIRGCRVGLGLGANYLHVDLREYASSWAYEDAGIPEADFDLWMLDQCEEFVGEQARLLARERACAEPVDGLEAVDGYREEMAGLAAEYRDRRTRGAVLLDVRRRAPSDDAAVTVAFMPADSPLLRLMDLRSLMERADRNNTFVFVVIEPDGAHRTGLMRYDGTMSSFAGAHGSGEEAPANSFAQSERMGANLVARSACSDSTLAP